MRVIFALIHAVLGAFASATGAGLSLLITGLGIVLAAFALLAFCGACGFGGVHVVRRRRANRNQ